MHPYLLHTIIHIISVNNKLHCNLLNASLILKSNRGGYSPSNPAPPVTYPDWVSWHGTTDLLTALIEHLTVLLEYLNLLQSRWQGTAGI